MPAAKVSGTVRSKNPLKGAVEILPERLYYAALKQAPPSHNILATTPRRKTPGAGKDKDGHNHSNNHKPEKKQIHFFSIDSELIYWNFFLDFGPLNLGQLYRFSSKLNDKLRKFPVVCFYSNTVPAKRANAIFLITAWQLLFLHRTPEQALAGFDAQAMAAANAAAAGGGPSSNNSSNGGNGNKRSQGKAGGPNNSGRSTCSAPPVSQSQGAVTVAELPPFHDASPCACTYDLTVRDCLDGMAKAIECGFMDGFCDGSRFDVDEYEHFEQVENGDLNWIVPGRILAFAGPSYERHVSPEGYCTLAPADYIPYFLQRKVDLVVRLNKKSYEERDFIRAGIRHQDAFFLDGSCPPMSVLNQVLDAFESVPEGKAFAVHCKAGLGRTGTCIGAYLMKHYQFTAAEIIAWMRICRPGCVIGPQQHFLQQLEPRMWQEGASLRNRQGEAVAAAAAAAARDGARPSRAAGGSSGEAMDEDSGDDVMQDRHQGNVDKNEKGASDDSDEAVRGRSGQAEGLLSARTRRPQPSSSSTKQQKEDRRSVVVTNAKIPPSATSKEQGTPTTTSTSSTSTPPITPETTTRQKASMVTPDNADGKTRLWFT